MKERLNDITKIAEEKSEEIKSLENMKKWTDKDDLFNNWYPGVKIQQGKCKN